MEDVKQEIILMFEISTLLPELGIHDFWIFVVSGFLLNLTPGPDTFYILGRTLAQGRNAGIASVLGISAGSAIHTLAAALGLSALLAASTTAFMIIKWAGAAYLIYLGVRMIFSRRKDTDQDSLKLSEVNTAVIFRQGLVTNLLNPKVAVFFLAFVPQFITPDSPAKFQAFLFLGFSFITTGTLWCFCLVGFASILSQKLRRNIRLSDWLNRGVGALFVFLGFRLAATR